MIGKSFIYLQQFFWHCLGQAELHIWFNRIKHATEIYQNVIE